MINLFLLPFKIMWKVISTILKIIFFPIWLIFHALASL